MSTSADASAQSDTSPVSKFAPELAQILVIFLWSSTFIVSKYAFAEVSPLAFLFARFLLMVILAFVVMFVLERGPARGIQRSDYGRFILSGLTGFTFYQLGFVLGLDQTSPFSAAILISMVPLFTMVALAIMGESTPVQGWLGLAVAIAGVCIFLLDKRDGGGGTILGDLLSVGAGVSFALYGIINRPLVKKYPVSTYTAWSILTGTIPLLIVSFPAAMQQPWATISLPAVASIIYMVIFPVYIAYILWNYAIAKRGVARASSAQLLVPVVTGIVSAIVFSEPFGPLKLVGAALVLAGLVIIRVPGLSLRKG